jgi:hypothetical protein
VLMLYCVGESLLFPSCLLVNEKININPIYDVCQSCEWLTPNGNDIRNGSNDQPAASLSLKPILSVAQ